LAQVRSELRTLLGQAKIQAVSGWHVSTVRHAIAPLLKDRVPYVYPAVYEGGEGRAGIYCTGEVPARALMPAMRWLDRHRGVRRWFVVGDDYVWPWQTLAQVRGYAADLGMKIAGSFFVQEPGHVPRALEAIEASGCDGVLVLMVGQNAVDFNRQFARRGLHRRAVRLSPLMDESALLASGPRDIESFFDGRLFQEPGHLRCNGTSSPLPGKPGPDCPAIEQSGGVILRSFASPQTLGPSGRQRRNQRHRRQYQRKFVSYDPGNGCI